jgi:hypothetical protein
MENGRTGVGPTVAGVSRRRSNESRLFFVAWAARPNHDAPHWPGRFFSLTLSLSQWSKFVLGHANPNLIDDLDVGRLCLFALDAIMVP